MSRYVPEPAPTMSTHPRTMSAMPVAGHLDNGGGPFACQHLRSADSLSCRHHLEQPQAWHSNGRQTPQALSRMVAGHFRADRPTLQRGPAEDHCCRCDDQSEDSPRQGRTARASRSHFLYLACLLLKFPPTSPP